MELVVECKLEKKLFVLDVVYVYTCLIYKTCPYCWNSETIPGAKASFKSNAKKTSGMGYAEGPSR